MRLLVIVMVLAVTADADSTEHGTVNLLGKEQFETLSPYIAKGRATYPEAKRRYLAGLPSGDNFVVRKHLIGPGNETVRQTMEGVYVAVDAVKNGKVYGRINSEVEMRSFRQGQRISFPESEVEDWAITHSDGSVEGDFVGKFLQKARIWSYRGSGALFT